ncbi:MAG TPA: cupredoxin domain-containing protein [Candidatus Limnocylindria bacterium]
MRFATLRRFAIGVPLTLSLLLGACSGAASPPASVSLDDCARVEDGVITISADNLEFSAPCMVATAGEAFTIHFENLESVPHDVAVYREEAKTNEIMRGEIITGPEAEVDYPVEALVAGEYYFVCTVHSAMNGTLFVVDA